MVSPSCALERWENELASHHRWGASPEVAQAERDRLRGLWDAAQPLDCPSLRIVDQIIGLEICNFNLEPATIALCSAIGSKRPSAMPIGHMSYMPDERWGQVWAYYAALRDWLSSGHRDTNGYRAVSRLCDRDAATRKRVSDMLGERTRLKELYVERLSLCIRFHLDHCPPPGTAQHLSHGAAVAAVETRVRELDPDGKILVHAFGFEGDGTLNICHHKVFRRYDIIISSIGAGGWRAAMPRYAAGGSDLADVVERYVGPIEQWLAGAPASAGSLTDPLATAIASRLGEPDPAKAFLASLLCSLLRSQQHAARDRAVHTVG